MGWLKIGSEDEFIDYIYRSGPYTRPVVLHTEERKMATSITPSRTALKVQAEALQRQLAEIQAGLASLVPDEPAGQGTVVRFRKYNRRYTYAAIRVLSEWYLTQNPTRPQDRKAPKTWAELLDFVGERNWDTIEVLS